MASATGAFPFANLRPCIHSHLDLTISHVDTFGWRKATDCYECSFNLIRVIRRQKDKDQKESSILRRQGSFVLLQCFVLSQDFSLTKTNCVYFLWWRYMQNLLCRPLWDDEGRQIQTFQWVITIPIILPSSPSMYVLMFLNNDDGAENFHDDYDDDEVTK